MKPTSRSLPLAFTALLALYALAYGLDRWMGMITGRSQTGRISSMAIVWNWPLLNILLAMGVLAYFIWVMPRLPRLALIFVLLLGVVVNFIPLLYFNPFGLRLDFLARLWSDRGYLLNAGAWTAVAAFFTLLRGQKAGKLEEIAL